MRFVKDAGGHVQASYQLHHQPGARYRPVRRDGPDQLRDLGADSICIKDMAG